MEQFGHNQRRARKSLRAHPRGMLPRRPGSVILEKDPNMLHFFRVSSMTSHTIAKLILSCSLLAMIANTVAAQETPEKKTEATTTDVPSGAQLYNRHCVACHGVDLKGVRPFPPPYRTPPDLTTLTQRHGGKFPATYVSSVLKNGVKLPAHGPAEMPVWGTDFAAKDRLDQTQVAARIRNLTIYIKTMQKP